MKNPETAPLRVSIPAPERPRLRRRYQPPAIVERLQLEAMAAECSSPGGKSDPTCVFGFS
ncbi:MAG: hypothetical protein AAGM22_21075 [Acidobacteriota bacterium]